MVYLNNIPQATDQISGSQSQILGNFAQLDAYYGQDHNLFSANINGHHKQITFDAPVSPVPTPAGTVSNAYSAAPTAQQELFWKNATAATQVTAAGNPIWKGGPSATASLNAGDGLIGSILANPGKMVLPNGITIAWGTNTANTNTNVAYGVTFSSNPYSVVASGINSGGSSSTVGVSVIGTSNFQVRNNLATAASMTFSWIAIGPT